MLEKIYNETYALDEDKLNPNDIIWEELNTAGNLNLELPKKVLLNDGIILDQKATKLCVAFGTTN